MARQSASSGDGPNFSCTTNPITPLKDVTVAAGKQAIMTPSTPWRRPATPTFRKALAWGWRVVSSNEPFTEGRPNNEKGNDKVVIVLTDGANTYGASATV